MIPQWSFAYFLIQVVAGFLGAHVAALATHEYRFGFIGHGLVGIVAGALSGLFLQRYIMTMVTGAGDVMPVTQLQALVVQVTTGLFAGAIAMMAAGFLRYEMAKASADKSDL
jgi:hypothetical protein